MVVSSCGHDGPMGAAGACAARRRRNSLAGRTCVCMQQRPRQRPRRAASLGRQPEAEAAAVVSPAHAFGH